MTEENTITRVVESNRESDSHIREILHRVHWPSMALGLTVLGLSIGFSAGVDFAAQFSAQTMAEIWTYQPTEEDLAPVHWLGIGYVVGASAVAYSIGRADGETNNTETNVQADQ